MSCDFCKGSQNGGSFQDNESVLLGRTVKSYSVDFNDSVIKKEFDSIIDKFLAEHHDQEILVSSYSNKVIISANPVKMGVLTDSNAKRRFKISLHQKEDMITESSQLNSPDEDDEQSKTSAFSFISEQLKSNEEYLEEQFIDDQLETDIEQAKQLSNASNEGKFECSFCRKLFASRSGRDTHQQLKHKIPDEFDAAAVNSHEVEAELESGELVRAWKCPLCSLVSRRKNHHLTHLIRHAIRDKDETSQPEVKETNLVISQIQSLHSYTTNVIPPPKKAKLDRPEIGIKVNTIGVTVYTCSGCRSVFKDKKAAAAHINKFNTNTLGTCENKICDLCGVIFLDSKSLSSHMRHHGMAAAFPAFGYHQCSSCSVIYKSKDDLYQHLDNHKSMFFQFQPETSTQLDTCDVIIRDIEALPSATDFYCGHCAKFGSKDDINLHLTFFHAELICPYDNRNFLRSLTYFYDHMKTKHLRRSSMFNVGVVFECTVENCDQTFSSKKLMSEHCKTCDKKKFGCDHCGLRFTLERQLKHHMTLVSGIKKHKCIDCDKYFANITELNVHLRTHTKEKPYTCTFPNCDKSFRTNSHLSTHLDLHNPDKIYKCVACSETFQTRGGRRIHEKHHEPIIISSCELCHKTFNQRSHYVRHVNSVHNINCKSSNLEDIIASYVKEH